ncbi:hypothetical protein O3M35_012712 [Rhynocoris fuscipes]|uniref:Uncharacterized protein n=1 Tax=Rhynocoris fuscipes TaxID=488301 RepID=A0AAW1CUK3_9HEMI
MAKVKKPAVKCCPLCQMKVGVASKTCPGCKHKYTIAKRVSSSPASNTDETVGKRRRTERVKREKPNFYDASEYEKKTRKQKALVVGNKELRGRPLRNEKLNKKKKKKPKEKKEEMESLEEEEPPPVLTAEKTRQCSVILAEINRKFRLTTWRV